VTDADRQRLIEDLKNLAASTPDPAKRDEILKTLEHLSDEWPSAEEVLRIRLRYSEES
jgi:hypothetical protein